MSSKVIITSTFKKDIKRIKKQHKNLHLLYDIVDKLANHQILDVKYRDHQLKNTNARECHIEPDWLLVYEYQNDKLILVLCRTGSHSELRI